MKELLKSQDKLVKEQVKLLSRMKITNQTDLLNFLFSIENDPKNQLAGYVFEYIAKAYYLAFSTYKSIYFLNEIPSDIKRRTGITRDNGVDLVAEEHNGRLRAIQVKLRSVKKTLAFNKDGLSHTLAHHKGFDGYGVFTNSLELDEATNNQVKSLNFEAVKGEDLSNLSEDEWSDVLQVLKTFVSSKKFKRRGCTPREYQQIAIEKVLNGFELHDRGKLIMACRTGKTPTSMLISEEMFKRGKGDKVVVAAPSLMLLKQMKDEWLKLRNIDFDFGVICSDESIGSSDDKDISEEEIGLCSLGVAKSDKDIVNMLNNNGRTVIFITYHSIPKLTEVVNSNELANFKFDLGFADEAHRTAGVKKSFFADFHNDKNIRINKRLYMTATPKIHGGNLKSDIVSLTHSMDDEAVFGPTFYELTFKSAIDQDIIRDFRIHISVISELEHDKSAKKKYFEYIKNRDELRENEHIMAADIISTVIATEKTLIKYGLRKVFAFFSKIKRAEAFSETYSILYPDRVVESISSKDKVKDRASKIIGFREGETQVLSNAKILTEGITVGGGDLVVIADAKNSKVDIAQAASRVLNKSETMKFGHVLLPVNIENCDSHEEMIKSGAFDPVVKTLRAMQDVDESLVEDLVFASRASERSAPGPRGGGRECRLIFDYISKELEEHVTIQALEKCAYRAARTKHTRQSVEENLKAKGYKNISEWYKDNIAEYSWTVKQPFYEEFKTIYFPNAQKQKKRTREEVEANLKLRKYESLKEWRMNDQNEYDWACKQDFYQELKDEFFPVKRKRTRNTVEESLRNNKYENVSKWKNDSPSEYTWTRKQDFYQELRNEFFPGHVIKTKITRKSVEKNLKTKRYKNIKSWMNDNLNEYGWARRQSFYDELKKKYFPNTRSRTMFRSREEIESNLKLKKYKTISEWVADNANECSYARRQSYYIELKQKYFPNATLLKRQVKTLEASFDSRVEGSSKADNEDILNRSAA